MARQQRRKPSWDGGCWWAASAGVQVDVEQQVLAGGGEPAGGVLQAVEEVQLPAVAAQELRGHADAVAGPQLAQVA